MTLLCIRYIHVLAYSHSSARSSYFRGFSSSNTVFVGVFLYCLLNLSLHIFVYVTKSQWYRLLLSTFAFLFFTLPFTIHLSSKWYSVIFLAENFLSVFFLIDNFEFFPFLFKMQLWYQCCTVLEPLQYINSV